jgi:hypothetical protein
MAIFAAIVLVLLVLLVIGGLETIVGLLTKSTAGGHVPPAQADESTYHVHYRVPHGQDTALVRAYLHEAGYDTASEALPDEDVLTIVLHDGSSAEVERVRQLLTETQDTALTDPAHIGPPPIRFLEDAR